MSSDLKTISKQVSVYGLFNILSKAVGFFLLPLYTRYLQPSEYGILELIEITASVFEMFASAGIGYAVFKFYHQYEVREEKDRVVSSAMTAVLGLHLGATIVGLSLSRKLSVMIFGSEGYQLYLVLIFFRIIVSGAISLGIDYVRVINKPHLFGLLSLSRLVSAVGFNVLFLVGYGLGVKGVLLSSILSTFLVGVPLITYLYRRVGFHFDLSKLVPMFKYGLPFVAVFVGQFAVNSADRFFLQQYTNLSEVGIYSLGYRFGFMVNFLVVTPFLLMWEGKMFEIAKRNDARDVYSRIFTYLVAALTFVALGLSLFIMDILRLMATPAYGDAAKIVPIIALAYVFNGMQEFFRLGMLIRSRTSVVGAVMTVLSVLCILGFFVTVRLWGAAGAATTAAGFYASLFLANFIFSQRLFPIRLQFWRLFQIVSAASLALAAGKLLPDMNAAESLFARSGVLFVFPGLLLVFGFLDEGEKRALRDFTDRLKPRFQRVATCATYVRNLFWE